MPTILVWLAQHRVIHLLIAVSYFSVVVLPHEWMGRWIYATFFPGDIDLYNQYFLIAALIGSIIFAAPLGLNLIRQKTDRLLTVGYLILTVVLMVLAYFTIFVLATELVHFPQYAIMAILLFPLSWRYGETLFWTTLLGALDEAYQYFYLAPQRTEYYDFNDVIINFLGAAFGLVFLRSFSDQLAIPKTKPGPKTAVLGTGLILILSYTAAISSGWLAVYPYDGLQDSTLLLVKKIPENFWSDFHHIRYHVILPEEGILLLVVLFISYSGLGRTSNRKLAQTNNK
jgi:glycopeptide antibiotics resistance protein